MMKTPPKPDERESESFLPKRTPLENAVLIITLLIALGAVSLLGAAREKPSGAPADSNLASPTTPQ